MSENKHLRGAACGGVVLAFLALASAAWAGPLDQIYDDADIADLAPLYQRGWTGNYEEVFKPVLTEDERAKLADVEFLMEQRVPNVEPFAFLAGGNTVVASAASLRFLEDIVMAHTWLEAQGLATQSVADYLLMLRNWDEAKGRPPKPWDVLCIPPDAFDQEPFGDRARRVFNSAAVFAFLHEYGHVLHGHPGNDGVTPDVSRANEAAADAFALDMFARVGDVPLGVTIMFFTMSHLQEVRSEFDTDELYMRTLAARTHPVSPERLLSLSRHLTDQAELYGRQFAAGRLAALGVSLEVSNFALLLGDPGVQSLSARIGQTVEPQDLAPRAAGRHLAAPCDGRVASGEAFDGTLHGKMIGGTTEFDLDTVLVRDGDTVTGSYSYGAGFGRIEGAINGPTLDYRWSMPPDSGGATLTFEDGVYRGSWGYGLSSSDGGTIEVRAE